MLTEPSGQLNVLVDTMLNQQNYIRTILLQRLSSGHKTAPYQCTGSRFYLDLAVLDSVPVPGLPGSRRAGVLITRLLRITCRDYGDES